MKKLVALLAPVTLALGCTYISAGADKIEEAHGPFCDVDGGGGGGAEPVACSVPSDCPDPLNPCLARTCTGGVCGVTDVPAGTRLAAQTPGDCRVDQCDGEGATRSVADDTDLPVDGNPCTSDLCVDGAASNPFSAARAPCGGGSVCDGAGACVACVVPTDCSGADSDCAQRTCTSHVCGVELAQAGTPTSSQQGGDCKQNVCDGAGSAVVQSDDTDLPVDGNACTSDLCSAGEPSNPPLAIDTPCGGGNVCDGAGSCVGCNEASECPGQSNDCQTPVCAGHQCGFSYAALGTLTSQQTAGDCKKVVCDGSGGAVVQSYDADLPVDGNACTADVCSQGVASNPNLAAGASCNQSGGSYCDGAGACVQCLTGSQCPSGVCTGHVCAAGLTLAYEKFGYTVGSAIAPVGGNGPVCPAGTCGGWITTARVPGTAGDGGPSSLGNSGKGWFLGPNSSTSTVMADTMGTLDGLASVGGMLKIKGTLEQNRVFNTIATGPGSAAAQAGIVGTTLDLAGNPFIERGTVWMTFKFMESGPDTANSYCSVHLYRGLGSSASMPDKPNEVLQFITNNMYNNVIVARTLGGAANALGGASFQGATPIGATAHVLTYKIELQVPGPCNNKDSSNTTVVCPVCPASTPSCYAAVTAWVDKLPDGAGGMSGAPDLARVVLANPTNYAQTTTIGGFSTVELGCTTQSGTVVDGYMADFGMGTTPEASRVQ